MRKKGLGLLALVICSGLVVTAQEQMPDPVATFSILGYDPDTGEIGGAVQSRVFTLTGVITADADAGVVATQAIVDVSYGPKGIELLKKGMAPDAIIKQIWESDPDPVPDRWNQQAASSPYESQGRSRHFTGPRRPSGRAASRVNTARRRATSSRVRPLWMPWSRRSRKRRDTCRCG